MNGCRPDGYRVQDGCHNCRWAGDNAWSCDLLGCHRLFGDGADVELWGICEEYERGPREKRQYESTEQKKEDAYR